MSNWILDKKKNSLWLSPNVWYAEQEVIEHYLKCACTLHYLPASSCSAVEGESVTDPRVDVIQTQLPLRSRAYCHCDECGITVRRLPLGVWWRGGQWDGWRRIAFSSSLTLSLPSLFPWAEAAHSQLWKPVDTGQTGVQLWRHGQGSCWSVKRMRHNVRFWFEPFDAKD